MRGYEAETGNEYTLGSQLTFNRVYTKDESVTNSLGSALGNVRAGDSSHFFADRMP